MTLRAVLLGIMCVGLLCGATYFNDFVLRQTMLVGSYMPISVFGALLLFVLLGNPALGAIRRRLALSGRELAVIVALLLAGCYVPGRGLMHYFSTLMMMPHQYARNDITWRRTKILGDAPPRMLADISQDSNTALGGFLSGLGREGHPISAHQIPWHAWWRALGFWVPLVATMSIAMIALAVVVHRQWSRHEKLRYPIAAFAEALLPRRDGRWADVFRTRSFWIAMLTVLAIHTLNYVNMWYEGKMIGVPTQFDFRAVVTSLPTFQRGGGEGLLVIGIIFTAVGFAYFLASDLSFSVGIAPFIYVYVVGLLAKRGLEIGVGGVLSLRVAQFLYAGAYFGVFLALLYTGRQYYLSTFRRALWWGKGRRATGSSVWATRVFLLASAGFVAQLWAVGLDWQLGVLYTLGAVVIFTVVSRVVAETGVFFIHSYCFPCITLLGVMGGAAIGPRALVIMLMVTAMLLSDPRESVMPFLVQALKLADMRGAPVGKTATFGAIALLVGFAIAIPVTLYWQYDRGVLSASDGWARGSVPSFPFRQAAKVKDELANRGTLAEAESVSGWRRFTRISPRRDCMTAFGVAVGLVLLFTAFRLRFTWWPLHPVMFLVLGTYQARRLAASFLLGWMIKTAVMRFGGARAYRKGIPVMVGLIAGDMLGWTLRMIVGALYYWQTGLHPKAVGRVLG